MKRFFPITAATAAILLLSPSCAQKDSASTGEDAVRYMASVMETFFPGVSANSSGIYILEDIPGTGAGWDPSLAYTYSTVTVQGINGKVTSTADEQWARQLGTYVYGNYYGPQYTANGENLSFAGVDAMLQGMKAGGKRKAVIPPWLLTTSRYATQDEYVKKCETMAPMIYTIQLEGQCTSPLEHQVDSMRAYVTRHYGADQDWTPFTADDPKEGQFYFMSDSTAFADKTRRETLATLKLNYTGRLLNGQLFDTTIEKEAKDAHMYNSAKSYSPVVINFNEKYTEVTMDGSSSLISGFKRALYLMGWPGQKATVIMASPLGYDSNGSGDNIPPYSPLIFELELLEY